MENYIRVGVYSIGINGNQKLYGADLRDADLRLINFKGADLREANLRNANLLGCNFEGADLEGALLGGAYLFLAKIALPDNYKLVDGYAFVKRTGPNFKVPEYKTKGERATIEKYSLARIAFDRGRKERLTKKRRPITEVNCNCR